MKKPIIQLLVLTCVFLTAATTMAVQKYEVIRLGNISLYPQSINNGGYVVGFDTSNSPNSNAYLISPYLNYTNLTPIPPSSGAAMAINNNNIIGGKDNGYATIFDNTGNGNNKQICDIFSTIYDLNKNNQAIGSLRIEGTETGASFNINGSNDYLNLGGIPQSEHAFSYRINNNGTIIGMGYNGRFFEEAISKETFAIVFNPTGNGNNTHLGGLYGTYGSAWDISNNGMIIGESHVLGDDPLMRATIFGPGQHDAFDLGTQIDDNVYGYSIAMGINNSDQIVGTIGDESGPYFATLFDNSGQGNNIDLNTLINPDSGWELLHAYDINDNGWIIGDGRVNGEYQRYLLKPVPEPATLALLLTGIIFTRRRG